MVGKQSWELQPTDFKKGRLYAFSRSLSKDVLYHSYEDGKAKDQHGNGAPDVFYVSMSEEESMQLVINLRADAEEKSRLANFIGSRF